MNKIIVRQLILSKKNWKHPKCDCDRIKKNCKRIEKLLKKKLKKKFQIEKGYESQNKKREIKVQIEKGYKSIKKNPKTMM